jgi:hypothetical protein
MKLPVTLISKARYKYDRFPKINSQENQEISILRIKEATTRLKLCLEVKEGPQNKDYGKEEQHIREELEQRDNKNKY